MSPYEHPSQWHPDVLRNLRPPRPDHRRREARSLPLVVYSGDGDACPFVEELAKVDFATKIFFSPSTRFPAKGMPALKKYEGYAVGRTKNGLVILQE